MTNNSWLYKKLLAALVLTMMALSMVVLPACSSSEESSDSSGDSDMSCDAGDTKQECGDDIF